MVGIKKKYDRREAKKERKALAAARLEKSIEAELLARLKSKAYGDAPLNVNEDVWKAVLESEKSLDNDELEEEISGEEESMDESEDERKFVTDESELEDLEEDEVCNPSFLSHSV